MDRNQKRELRKRGAATRGFTTGNILIESPLKQTTTARTETWEKLDNNVLLSQPIVQRGFEVEDIRNDAYFNDYGDEFVSSVDVKRIAKKTLEISNKSKNKKKYKPPNKPKTESLEYSEIKEQKKPEPKKKNKRIKLKSKKKEITTKRIIKSNSKIHKSTIKKSNHTSTEIESIIKITRLPTSTSRLTSIDVLLHYLRSLIPRNEKSKSIDHFQIFKDFNEDYFLKTLDLNLVNNDYIHKLKQIKHEKANLRQQLYEIKNSISEKITELDVIRQKYNQLKEKIQLNKKLEKDMKDLTHVKTEIMGKLTQLNAILDPNFGLYEKLKLVNEKLQLLDRELN